MSEKTVLNIENYLKQKKLYVQPHVIIKIITDFTKLQTKMIQEKAKKYIISIEDCIHCQEKRKNNPEITTTQISRKTLCKKHRAIFDWKNKNTTKTAIFNYHDRVFHCFTDYAAIQMPTDPNGVFVIYFGNSDVVFGLSKTFFKNIFDVGVNITSDILQYQILLSKNWIVNMNSQNPIIEKVKD